MNTQTWLDFHSNDMYGIGEFGYIFNYTTNGDRNIIIEEPLQQDIIRKCFNFRL